MSNKRYAVWLDRSLNILGVANVSGDYNSGYPPTMVYASNMEHPLRQPVGAYVALRIDGIDELSAYAQTLRITKRLRRKNSKYTLRQLLGLQELPEELAR